MTFSKKSTVSCKSASEKKILFDAPVVPDVFKVTIFFTFLGLIAKKSMGAILKSFSVVKGSSLSPGREDSQFTGLVLNFL
jgi:hypothetical protein